MRWPAALITAIGLTAFGQEFEVAAIKRVVPDPQKGACLCEPNGTIGYRTATLRRVIRLAYDLQDMQLVGPEWMNSEFFDIDAKPPGGTPRAQLRPMLGPLLAKRFRMRSHWETRTLTGYALSVDEGGLKMSSVERPGGFSLSIGPGVQRIRGTVTIGIVVDHLSKELNAPVVDETGLKGVFAVNIEWVPERVPDAPGLRSVLQQELGLQLEPRKMDVKILVIDHIDKRPTKD
jgi:uncharacterized protein (TIGR03435 family)